MRRTKEDAEKTRAAILDAAEKVFYQQGVARTSLQEIAEAAGVTRGAVYWHFRNKNEVLEALTERVVLPQEHVLERLLESGSDNPIEDIHNSCRETFHKIIHDPQRRRIVTILFQRCEYTGDMASIVQRRLETKERMFARVGKVFEKAQKKEKLALGWTPRVAAMTLQGLIMGLIIGALEREPDPAYEKTCYACLAAFFRAVSA